MSMRFLGGYDSTSYNPLASNITTSPNVVQWNGVYTLQQAGQALTAGKWATDPYYKQTTLLLHADGKANGSQNNTFLDSSTNNFTITRNGNTTQGTFSPYMPNGYWGNYFDGSSYLSTSNSAGYQFGTGDFTVECWINKPSASNGAIVDVRSPLGAVPWALYVDSSNFPYFYDGTVYTSTVAIVNNAWNHIAVIRTSGVLKIFVNGVQGYSAANSVSLNAAGSLTIAGTAAYSTGYISNFRIVKGTAVYTSAFTPSTTPLTAISGTSLLTCQSNRFVDNSGNNNAISVGAGSPSVQQFQPFMRPYQYTPSVVGGSGYFDGSGDYLSVAPATAIDVSTGDFTIEFWANPTQTTNAVDSVFGYGAFTMMLYHTGSNWSLEVGNGSSNYFTISTARNLNAWTHIAITRSGNTFTFWKNGVSSGTATNSGAIALASKTLTIGWNNNASQPSQVFTGSITNFRLVKGTAIYTTAFTPPTEPLTAISGTSLLTNFTNAGIYDNAMMNNLETVGNAQVSTSVVKYGSGSLYFDGSGDYLISPNYLNGDLGTGDFTVEYWFRCGTQGSPSYVTQVGTLSSTTVAKTWRFGTHLNATAGVYFAYHNGTTFVDVTFSTINFNDNTWHHAALTRSSNTVRAFIDGIQIGTNQTITQDLSSGQKICVGAELNTNTYYTGYLDDLRITKGVARYTANFQPPQVAFANQ